MQFFKPFNATNAEPVAGIISLYDFSKLNVAVADDSAFFRTSLRHVLLGLGIRAVFEAEDGDQCLKLIERQRPDILFLDWEMPVKSGPEVMRDLRRKEGCHPYLPVIMVTAYSNVERVKEATTLGIHELLCKPIAAKPVYQRLVSVVRHPRPFVKTETYFGPVPRNGKPPKDDKQQDFVEEEGNAFVL